MYRTIPNIPSKFNHISLLPVSIKPPDIFAIIYRHNSNSTHPTSGLVRFCSVLKSEAVVDPQKVSRVLAGKVIPSHSRLIPHTAPVLSCRTLSSSSPLPTTPRPNHYPPEIDSVAAPNGDHQWMFKLLDKSTEALLGETELLKDKARCRKSGGCWG